MKKNLGVNMNDTKKRELWLQELKKLKTELLQKNGEIPNQGFSSPYKASKTYQKNIPGLSSKMFEKDQKESAKIQVFMLALITFIFETLFFVGSYLLFKK